MVGVAVPLHALVRMWYFEATMTYMLWVLSLIGIGMCIFSMWVLWSASRAAGADLNLKDGILEYFKDLIIVGAATLVLTCLTDWFFLLYIFVSPSTSPLPLPSLPVLVGCVCGWVENRRSH